MKNKSNTAKSSSLRGRKVNSPRPQRFLVGEGRISMRKLSIRNSGEGTTHTNTPQLKGLPPFETLESKQSGELFARGNTDPRHASRDVTYPRFICLAN